MTSRIDVFPDILVEQLVLLLEPKDLYQLSLASKTLYTIFSSNSIWRSKSIHDFGNVFHIYTIFTTATGLELQPDLKEKFSQEPQDWKRYYLAKNAEAQSSTDDEKLMDEADKEYASAQKQLNRFQQTNDLSILNDVASKMIRILDVFPGHGGCYYMLAFILFVLNQLEEAVILLRMGRAVDDSFEPFDELEQEIQRILDGYKGSKDGDQVQLLTDDSSLSSTLAEVLLEIFARFDKDQDGALNAKELGQFILETNGSRPPPPFLRQMGQRFGCDARGSLTKNGFLAFYLEQTLDDPSETRNDLGVHGYDPHTLRKNMEE
ncbi:hypothetical protein DM01DRAFT_1335344 [Hesseltinella vesiculosa]|uniref:EF-hand domain-containing protein n=1 Tax=Hesseltinella vesiculosa TaxID=101127 RepID=A0A1X2GJC4_9FUNG|nr:hypothetical protein DM01DRAFT_1335344 [Hesseltinella vesiculosa]